MRGLVSGPQSGTKCRLLHKCWLRTVASAATSGNSRCGDHVVHDEQDSAKHIEDGYGVQNEHDDDHDGDDHDDGNDDDHDDDEVHDHDDDFQPTSERHLETWRGPAPLSVAYKKWDEQDFPKNSMARSFRFFLLINKS